MKWTGILTGVFLTDTILKSRAEKHLSDKAVREIAGDKILLRKLHNYGLACNLGEKHPKLIEQGTLAVWITMFLTWLRVLKKPLGKVQGILVRLGGALVLGGGLSNLNDRITKGYVTDYFSFNVKSEKLRRIVFNISDMCIAVGAVLAALGCIGSKK
ncbi:MAG: signal peptidase II [Oliverpabstia sp.]|nr:signal peptidase II [Eubacterium sp.]MDY2596331.1 signal peptidase II [Oliverpabstia sp.]